MSLRRLTDLMPGYAGAEDPVITGLTADSRAVRPGYLFAALPGTKADGREYIANAVKNGAAAILFSPSCEAGGGVRGGGQPFAPNSGVEAVPPPLAPPPAGGRGGSPVFIESGEPRRDLARLAAAFYPRQPETVVAVTGTNGKTSTADFTRQLWAHCGLRAASLGTLGIRGEGVEKPGSMTTPDTVALHAELESLAGAGVTHLAMEASSHGIDQHRLDGVCVSAAGFTNLTLDHLDYHGTMDAYRAAKLRLFSEVLVADGVAVLNADSPEFGACRAAAAGRTVVDYGRMAQWLKLERLTVSATGQRMDLSVNGRQHSVDLPLASEFMAMNALCALGLAASAHLNDRDFIHILIDGLARLKGAPGRLQRVGGPDAPAVYVDYAHTPDALEQVLKALRFHAEGRLITIIGCGGDRDRTKRPVMGRIASALADIAIVTDDNPRSEDPAAIRAAVLQGANGQALEIGDRHEAIARGVAMLEKGDVLVICGKGHEQGQTIQGQTLPFDDVKEAEKAMGMRR
jgi:UDP-N-acetylmuramoyl-L-alanyl-D-glutamate--2,6-diaminopimelate ligase